MIDDCNHDCLEHITEDEAIDFVLNNDRCLHHVVEYLITKYPAKTIEEIYEALPITHKMPTRTFNRYVNEGKIIIGGLGNPDGVRIIRSNENYVWFQ